ncbi:nucleotidyltransferase domain-containing protein [Alteribacter natronophilus]|uniref:nucleotidyltransferase domain-containing protein n=1 Tax=Alteribacter natronophilus TaxID=2583810 RepID=UPI00110F486E|nr:nucleotidyltransferase domain-containing protein [Alteribacter natronophilus]TMW70370.1 nucleotidyltransferase domain-containing protein [Alteribacter natronophilus]
MNSLQEGYGLDRNGFIVSDVSLEKIDGIYLPCIRDAVGNLAKLFQDQLHSVYVYGSVARGEAVPRKSDLDIMALFNGRLSSDQSAEVKNAAGELSQKYGSLVREVGIAAGGFDYVTDTQNYYEQAFLKELCVCVHGEDLRKQFGPYNLSAEIAISFNGDICRVFTRIMSRLEAASDEEFRTITQSFSRKLIRTYYSMVMVRSRIWTTRLSEQAEVVIRHFPHKKTAVRTLKKWVDNPGMERASVYKLFKKEGKWTCEHFLREAEAPSSSDKKEE